MSEVASTGNAVPDVSPPSEDRHIELIGLADSLYRRRSEPGAVCSSWAEELERKLGGYESYDLEWRLSRAMFLGGDVSPELYALGAYHGRRAAALERNRVEGPFWTGVNLALHAQARKGLRGVLALLEARRALRRACAISEGYHGAGPLRVLGRLEHKAPRLLGGSIRRSLSYYERALRISPTNTVTLVYAAELEIERRDYKSAADRLQTVLNLPVDPDWEFESVRDKRLAGSLLEQLRLSGVD